MGAYDFRAIEKKWQQYWKENRTFVADQPSDKPKYYVLDMFPYPSGAGLHVGHPLGYIATDIITRYKRLKGFNVLHPMGFDAFGLPAEQYAIKFGIHPAETTRKNIARYLEQMETLGFHYDPDTTLATSDPDYYKWTQWIFIQLFEHWYDKSSERARPISELADHFAQSGNADIVAATSQRDIFDAAAWNAMSEQEQSDILMNFRLAYLDYATVNWCPALGTVLANEEVKDGKSERGGHPVERKKMRQWMLRITAYADRMLEDLNDLDWSEAMKAIQTNWIGRSEGANITYQVEGVADTLEVFTTRPDTLYGNTFMVVAPEHPIVDKITTDAQRAEVDKYVEWAENRSEKDRIADTTKTGVWTGGYAIHPMTGNKLPIWIADYVVITYGTGAIMAVPAHDERDFEFAHKFGIDIVEVISGGDISKEAFISKEGIMVNSDFLNGMKAHEAITAIIQKLEEMGIGNGKVTYRQRDVIWSRQRYWGEPTPIVYKDGIPSALPLDQLPLTLPEVDEYKPSAEGEPPLSRAEAWKNLPDGSTRDLNTMPGLAGSSWYFLRYPDAKNDETFVDSEKEKYWLPVDLYVGGTEHAVGHLMYSRFWTKFLYDLGEVSIKEPFKKLVNQGMIQGTSQLALRHTQTGEYVSADLVSKEEMDQYSRIHAKVQLVKLNVLDVAGFKEWAQEPDAVFKLNEEGEFKTISEVEKMSKSKFNTVDPDDICHEYGADTMRLYEMFLGPIEIAKPWNTDGITGVFQFLKRAWKLFYNDEGEWLVTDEAATKEELKQLHLMLKKVEEGVERLAFNTCVPAFMVFSKEILKAKSHKREILEPFLLALSPFAPHMTEELWQAMGHDTSILLADYPEFKEEYLVEDSVEYPVQVNGKVRTKVSVPANASKDEIQAFVLEQEAVKNWMDGKEPRKVIVVPGRIVNIVV
ncbi:leucine--tRNA ligase [Pontibacter sp. G13]|uniref:leucine--tRNA ligase n=1 Tax=Pontibacter sp. G13 TaxID=3074898 RepID=UPI0028898AB4|nr:leucine--tRNA ligase [Pontibacter sp. G13]WNJ17984.1 leucine--tRNA ligase [Pontibacter sp. G13]